MEEEDGWTLPLIDVMHLAPGTLVPVGLEGEQTGIRAKISRCHGDFRLSRSLSNPLGVIHGSFVSEIPGVQGGGRLEH